ncbi:MAG: hypothetical protein ACE5G1_07650 [bacterium]
MRKLSLLSILMLYLQSCQHNLDINQTELDAANPVMLAEKVSFRINQATLIFDGKVLSERLTLSQDDFGFFFLWVRNEGLFAVTIFPISISIPAGNFTGNRMLVEHEDHRIELISQSDHLFNDGKDRGAYLVHIPEFDIFGPDVKPADTVIGAVTELNQIPRYAN